MGPRQYFKSKIFSISSDAEFNLLAVELFRYQYQNNPLYRKFSKALRLTPDEVQSVDDIPFLPISFFKSDEVKTGQFEVEKTFSSSGTGGQASQHFLADLDLYEQSFTSAWNHFYGPIEKYCVLALLPAYLERQGSSLVYMADNFIRRSEDADSGFYLDDLEGLHQKLLQKIEEGRPVLLLGVTFALLDLAEKFQLPQNNLIIMETGGMKGRRKEMIRKEVHEVLINRLGVSKIHSEYGMTELLSQAYSQGEGLFKTPHWMKISVRQTDDPLSKAKPGKTGGLNLIDLANIDSCAFIATQDLAREHIDKRFEVMGRFDNSDIRGCNLMVV